MSDESEHRDAASQPLPPALVAWLNREQRAMGDTLRDEIDQRLGGIERGLARAGKHARADTGWWRRHRVDVYALVLAAGLGWTLWQVEMLRRATPGTPQAGPGAVVTSVPSAPTSASGSTAETTSSTTQPVTPSTPPIRLRLDADNPRDSWIAFVREEPVAVAAALRAAAEAADASTATRLRTWAEETEAGAVDWGRDRIEASLETLFEQVARDVASSSSAATPGGSVDGTVGEGEYTVETLTAVLEALGVRDRVTEIDPTHRRLQASVVIAWLERRLASAGGPST